MIEGKALPTTARTCCREPMFVTIFRSAGLVKHECLLCYRTLQLELVDGVRHGGEYRARTHEGKPITEAQA